LRLKFLKRGFVLAVIQKYWHSLLIFCRTKWAFNVFIARRSETTSWRFNFFFIGSCLARSNILSYFLSNFRKACVCILFVCLQSSLEGAWKAEEKAMFFFVFFTHLILTQFVIEKKNILICFTCICVVFSIHKFKTKLNALSSVSTAHVNHWLFIA